MENLAIKSRGLGDDCVKTSRGLDDDKAENDNN